MRAKKSDMGLILRWVALALAVISFVVAAVRVAKLQNEVCALRSDLNTQIEAANEAAKPSGFDTSVLENWCGDFSNGSIRMISSYKYGTSENGGIILCDEFGNLWDVGECDIATDDFVLLWIADNHTPGVLQDDIVLKIWIEAHGAMG